MSRTVHVLVIDDDPDVRNTTQWVLEGAGFDVSAVTNGEQGLRAQRAQPADVVVTDIYMPDKDGIETIVELRAEFPQLPIVAVSGGSPGTADYLFVARELGVHEVLRKPFDPAKLIDVVREAARAAMGE